VVSDVFSKYADVGLVYGDGRLVSRSGKKLKFTVFRIPFDFKALIRRNYLLQPSTFVRSSAFRDVGGFRAELKYAFDWDLWIRVAKRFPVIGIPDSLSIYHVRPGSLSLTAGAACISEFSQVAKLYGGPLNPSYLGLLSRLRWASFLASLSSIPVLGILEQPLSIISRKVLGLASLWLHKWIDFQYETRF
jgi:hypothetical protein